MKQTEMIWIEGVASEVGMTCMVSFTVNSLSQSHSAKSGPAISYFKSFNYGDNDEVIMPSFALLTNSDKPFYPHDGCCPTCHEKLMNGFAYLSAGALRLTADGQDSVEGNPSAFFHVGLHGKGPEMVGSANVSLVNELQSDQFDLQWCSIECMRKWLMQLLDHVELLAKN